VKREIEIDRFPGISDSGKEYIVVRYQEYISVPSFDNPDETPGKERMVTSTGLLVHQIGRETFKIVQTNEIVRKV
jgi:hypothetical protein